MSVTLFRASVVGSALLVGAGVVAIGQTLPLQQLAQTKQPPAEQKPKEQKPKEEARAKTPPAAPNVAVPDANKLVIMIQNAVIAANQANLSGNYTVLHALAAPGFQSANPPEKLAQVFADLRNQRIDMSPVVLFLPRLSAAPGVTEHGMLRLTGSYDTQPKQVRFDLLFQPVDGQWKIFGIGLGAVDAPPPPTPVAGAAPKAAPAAKPDAPAKKQ